MPVIRRDLLTTALGGIFSMGYTMTADEQTFWQERAALLDPLAYEHVLADATTRTVPAGERWYLLNGWHLDAPGAGTTWFHRPADVARALVLGTGTAIVTGTPGGGNTAFMWICKPVLVTATDSRYSSDPRGLYFDRIERLGELTQYRIGTTNTGLGTTSLTFPTDFTYGMGIHTSTHDVGWMILTNSGGTGMANTHNEISDTDRIRWAEPTLFPFTRTTMPKLAVRGANQSEGRATLTYLKLPNDW